jgi:S-adenosylmethionine:tRNA ribosyltransferase-isomerase
MKLAEFDYELPADRIAQRPLAERDASRLLLVSRESASLEDRAFRDLPGLLRGDELIVVNNARVIPARLFGRRAGVHAQPVGRHSRARREHLAAEIEVLLTRRLGPEEWEALVRPGRKIRTGERIAFGEGELVAEVVGRGEYGLRRLRFPAGEEILEVITRIGHVPLPPYIRRADEPQDRERYQTVFAEEPGAVAAPTAALHFTPAILNEIRGRGAEVCALTLHVGLGTFQPIRTETVEAHRMHVEPYEINAEVAERIRSAKRAGRPVLAVGTTVVRALEDAAQKALERGAGELLAAGRADADIFIRPGHNFRIVDQLLTNFHLPRSSLLVMVSAFAGRERILAAYRHAVAAGYRFYSYGDAMLIR